MDRTRRSFVGIAARGGLAGPVLALPGEARAAMEAPTLEELYEIFVPQALTQPADHLPVVQWTIEPRSWQEGRARFALACGAAQFESITDPTLFLGYNAEVAAGGGRDGELMLALGFEGFYPAANWAGSSTQQDTMEWYVEYRNADRSIVDFRPVAVTLGRDGSDRWSTTHIDIGTDRSAAKSQFFVRGEEDLVRVTNDVITMNRRLQLDGHPTYLNSTPPGNNAHVFFLQNNRLLWVLGNFIHDRNHYLWDQTHNRPHVTYLAGETSSSASTRMESRLEVSGSTELKADASVSGRLSVEGAVSTEADLGVAADATVGGDLVVEGANRLTGDVGFFGQDPTSRRPASPDATDLASAIALINELKADLVALGLKAAAGPAPETSAPPPEPPPSSAVPSPTEGTSTSP